MAKTVVGHLIYKLTGESAELDKALSKGEQSVARFTKFIKSALGIGGAVLSIRALIGIGKDLVAAYAAQEKAEAMLAAALRATGEDVDALMLQYKDFASEIQRTTTIGDEQVLGLLQAAKSFGIATDRMQEATQGAIGLSKAFGIDMNTALRGIALAYQGNYIMLNRYIPALRTVSTEAEKQALLQKAMADGFQIARAEAETATGRMLQLQNAIGDLKEEGGRAIADFMKPAVTWLTQIVAQAAAGAAEMNRLRELVAASQERELTTAERLELVSRQIQQLEMQRASVTDERAAAIAVQNEIQIKALKQQQAALAQALRYEEQGAALRRKGEQEAAAAAEAEAKRQAELATWIKAVNDEYAKTEEGQREILLAQIAKWEYELSRANVYKPQIQAILDMLYKQRDANIEIADTWKDRLDAMTAETEAALETYQLRLDAEQAMHEELARIRIEATEAEKWQAEEVEQKWQQVRQSMLDFAVSIWGQLGAIYSAQTQREMDLLRRRHDLELESFTGTEEEKKKLADQFKREEAKAEYEGALRSWKMQRMGALAAMARAIIESMKLGFPWAIPMVALAKIQGALQLAALHAAKPVPAFAEGVDMVVPPGYPDDSFLFRAETGEHLTVEPKGERTETVVAAPVVIQIDGTPVYRGLLRASRNRIALLDERAVVK